MDLDNIKMEGELYSDKVRGELGLVSYLGILIFAGFAWALVGGVFAVIFAKPATSEIASQGIFYGVSVGIGAVWGFTKIITAGLMGYPLYKLWCSRNRGQSMRGKFAVKVPANPSNNQSKADAKNAPIL